MKIGDAVQAKYVVGGADGKTFIGTLVDIESTKEMFSEKYNIVETVKYAHIFVGGEIMVFTIGEDHIEVVNEE